MAYHLTTDEFGEALDGARVVRWDAANRILYVWSGGHDVNGYMPAGDGQWTGTDFFNTGDFANRDAAPEEVRQAITERIESGLAERV